MAEWIGQQIGNYRITGLLGEGGMAAVYRAERLTIQSDVAIKLIKPGLVSPEKLGEFTRRFTREAETIARLSHPHILKMFDYGQHANLIYIVMELLPGGSLADLIARKPLPLPDAARLLDQMADALDYAHEQGIVHRDLKPQNVLLDSRGNAFLTDFGIAKLLNDSTALTQSGLAMGTPTYMSPEQCQGQQVDARSDLYSLGVILFQMLTGDVPFKADTPVSLLYLHISQPPPRLSEYRQVPEAVERVLSKALAKRPQDRFSSAGELAAAFRTALTGQMPVGLDAVRSGVGNDLTARTPAIGIPFPPPQPSTMPARRRGGLLALGVVALVALLIAVGLLLAGRSPEAAPVAQASSTDTALPLIVQLPTGTSTDNPTPTNTPSTTPTMTSTVTATPTDTFTPMPRLTDTPFDVNDLIAATFAAEVTQTAIAIASFTKTPTATFTLTQTPTDTPDVPATVAKGVELTRTAIAVASFTKTPTPTATKTPTATFTPSSTPTATFTPSDTPTVTQSNTPTATLTPLPPGATRTDAYGVTQVWVPAGCFRMGSDPAVDKAAQPNEQPQREVCLTQGYWIDQTEVTNAAYGQFINAGGYTDQAYWSADGWQWRQTNNISRPDNYNGFTDPQQPRVGVSWYEAEAYARWRGCRLPTEAEWEYAARGPKSPIYPWGNQFQPANLVYSSRETAVVGPDVRRAGASWVGALDMSGNVWEWVVDWYQADYYRSAPKDNPPGPTVGRARVVRGGSWLGYQSRARAAYRDSWNPGARVISLGFRVVCAAPVSP